MSALAEIHEIFVAVGFFNIVGWAARAEDTASFAIPISSAAEFLMSCAGNRYRG
ncbi:MAG: hypothetical protein U0872_12245 [Planctomycetaceae bacterium]